MKALVHKTIQCRCLFPSRERHTTLLPIPERVYKMLTPFPGQSCPQTCFPSKMLGTFLDTNSSVISNLKPWSNHRKFAASTLKYLDMRPRNTIRHLYDSMPRHIDESITNGRVYSLERLLLYENFVKK